LFKQPLNDPKPEKASIAVTERKNVPVEKRDKRRKN